MPPLIIILDDAFVSEPHWIAEFHSKPQIQDGRHKKAQTL